MTGAASALPPLPGLHDGSEQDCDCRVCRVLRTEYVQSFTHDTTPYALWPGVQRRQQREARTKQTMTTVETRRVFRTRNAEGHGLQQQAFDWADTHWQQGDARLPFVVFNCEMRAENTSSGVAHQFEAVELTTMLNALPANQTRAEIVCGPCKFYADCEVKYGTEADCAKARAGLRIESLDDVTPVADEALGVLLASVAAQVRALGRADIDEADFVVTTASKADKWSAHVTLDGSSLGSDGDERESFALAAPADADELLQRALATIEDETQRARVEFICDWRVYHERRAMRTYWSGKALQPERRLLTTADRESGATRPCRLTMARALITCLAVRADRVAPAPHAQPADWTPLVLVTWHYCANAGLDLAPVRLRSTDSAPRMLGERHAAAPRFVNNSATLTRLLETPEFAVYEPLVALAESSEPRFVVRCRGARCDAAPRGEHSKGHECVYLVLDLLARQWHQTCHSSTCKDARDERQPHLREQPFTAAQARLVTRYLHEDWPAGHAVGAALAAALGIE